MTWAVEVRPEAAADIESAADWYELQSPGLGKDFVAKVAFAISGLADQPELPRLRHRRWNIRWIYPRRFPYRIVYQAANGSVIVLAVLHAARHESAWRGRVD